MMKSSSPMHCLEMILLTALLFSCPLPGKQTDTILVPLKEVFLRSGDVVLRLDGRKFDNINSIRFKGHQMALDNPYAHYGQVALFKDLKKAGHLGSGHTETGQTERLLSMDLVIDGRAVAMKEGGDYTGHRIVFRKSSLLRNLRVDYQFVLCKNMLHETAAVTAEENEELVYLYCFMHPWLIDFTDCLAIDEKNAVRTVKFVSDQKFPINGRYPLISWRNSRSGLGVVSLLLRKPRDFNRFVWDRPHYRKDYIQTYRKADFPRGTFAEYEMKTAFLEGLSAENWEKKVRSAAECLGK